MTSATYRVKCPCGAILYDDLLGDEHPTEEAAAAARAAAGWDDGPGCTRCTDCKTNATGSAR